MPSLPVSLHSSHHHSLPRCKHHPPGCDTDEGSPPFLPRKLTTTGDYMCDGVCDERESRSKVISMHRYFLFKFISTHINVKESKTPLPGLASISFQFTVLFAWK